MRERVHTEHTQKVKNTKISEHQGRLTQIFIAQLICKGSGIKTETV